MSEQKYTTSLPDAVFGTDGLAVDGGWAVMYGADNKTREYIGVSRDYIQTGFSLPAGAYLDAPVIIKDKNKAICRTEDGKAWEYLDDFRGKEIYNTQTRQPMQVQTIGPVPEGWTLSKPDDDFAVWDGEKWQEDTEARHKHEVSLAVSERETRIKEADQTITMLERVVKSGTATEEEKELLDAWNNYSVIVYRINPEDAPDIAWPDKPE